MKTIYQPMRSLFLFAALICFAASLKAQTITIGSTANPNQYNPIYTFYGNNYSQTIYLASEMIAAGGSGPATINSISFFYANVGLPTNTWENWEIFLANTPKTAFANSTDWVSGLSPVFSGTVTAPATAGQWMTITLSTPFIWDGSSNLVVGVHENSPGYTNGNPDNALWASTPTTDKRTILYYADNTDPDPASPPASIQDNYSYASAKFDLTTLSACVGTPSPAITVSSSYSVCTNSPFTLSLSGGPLATGLSYQWQSSPNGSTWSNMGASQITWNYAISNQTVTTYYRCITTCVASAASSTSTPVSVTQNSILDCFCTAPNLDCNNGYYMTGIDFATLSGYNPICSPGTNSYQDLAGIVPTISVTAGQTYTFNATTNQSGDFILGTWIDYNNNGVYDPWEYSQLATGNTSGAYTSPVAIPFTAQAATVRMRLVMEAGNLPQNPCSSTVSNGQVLDFLVNITGLPGCVGTPTAGAAVSTSTSVCSNSPYTLNLSGTSTATGMSFQWQSSPNGTAWTNLGSAQAHIPYIVSTQTATTHYRCIVTCVASAQSSTSTPVVVNQSSFLLCYCNPGSISCGNTYFTNINFATINTSSIICNGTGYEDLTTTTGTVSAGQTYTMSVNLESNSDVTYASAWIDTDHSGSFDAHELINIGSTYTYGTITFTTPVTVPFTSLGGLTTMRIKTESNYNQVNTIDPCMDTENDGHTIDYSIFINAAPNCSGTPLAGTAVASSTTICTSTALTLNLSGNSQVTGNSYQWQYSLNNSTWTNLGASQSHVPYVVSNQTVATYYRCVVTCVGSTQSQNSASVMVSQSPFTACYCIPPPMDCSGNDEISQVVLGTVLTNTSACSAPNGYTDYTSTVATATITAGTSYTLDVTLGSDSYEEVHAWIDYNRNGSFDTWEYTNVGNPGGSGNYTATATMAIPAIASSGLTRMRIRNISGKTLNSGDACINPAGGGDRLLLATTYGETEDYAVYILPASCSGQNLPPNMAVSASAATVCPNAAVTLSITSTIPNYTGYTYQWQSSPNGSSYTNIGSPVTNPSITVNPTQNKYYICEILCNGTSAVTTSSVFVAVNGPTVTVTAPSYSICPAEPLILTAGGAVTYVWTHNGTTSATVAVTPTATTVYTVTGTGTNGCSSTGTVSIFVKPATGITGTITTASVPVPGTAILYKYEPFFTKFDSITSQAIAGNGGYNFASVNYGIYIVKAVPSASSLQVTYGLNSINWKTAIQINHTCASADVQDINVVALTTLTVGPGSMSGKIEEGQGFGQRPGSALSPLAPGQPIKGVIVKGGKNPGGNMFAQTVTGSNGTYTLSGLPNNQAGEEYFILVDIPGLDTNGTYHRVISTGSNTYMNLNFIVDSARINPVQDVSVRQSAVLEENSIKVYPNPSNGNVSIAYTLSASSHVSVELYDVVGKSLKTIVPASQQGAGTHTQQVTLSELSQGMYFVKLRINESETSVKLFVTN
jgi:hypothetical protein